MLKTYAACFSTLDFFCDVNAIPVNSPFAASLEYVRRITPVIEAQIVSSEETLRSLIDRLGKMGLGDSISSWLDGDPGNSFFEFKVEPDPEVEKIFKNIDLIASKSYHSSGIITITIIFRHNVYVTLLEAGQENPLLDSRFPDISGKGRGYQIQSLPDGSEGWSCLRKVSIWQVCPLFTVHCSLSSYSKQYAANATQIQYTAIVHSILC